MKSIHYLCLQTTNEGQASHAHVHEIIHGLEKLGWQVSLFEPTKGIRSNLLTRLSAFCTTQWRLWRAHGHPDALYVRSHYLAFPTSLWARARGIPIVQEMNGPFEDLFLAWPWTRAFAGFFRHLLRQQLAWADAVITVTPELKTWLHKEIGAEKDIYVVPNGANTKLFHPASATEEPTLDRPYAMFFGALASWQGIDSLLTAIDDSNWPQSVDLVVVGDGVERQKVELAAARNPLIRYLGRQPYHRMPRLIAQSLCCLSPKNHLGDRQATGLSPLKLYETLACGVPIIVTDLPGQADLVRENDCGLVVAPEDKEALAKAVKFLQDNPEAREEMGRRGRKAIESDHSWEKRALDTSGVLSAVIGRNVETDPSA